MTPALNVHGGRVVQHLHNHRMGWMGTLMALVISRSSSLTTCLDPASFLQGHQGLTHVGERISVSEKTRDPPPTLGEDKITDMK